MFTRLPQITIKLDGKHFLLTFWEGKRYILSNRPKISDYFELTSISYFIMLFIFLVNFVHNILRLNK